MIEVMRPSCAILLDELFEAKLFDALMLKLQLARLRSERQFPKLAKRVKEIVFRQGGQYKLGKGCPACKNTGFLGRMGIFEILLMNEEIRKQVLANSSTDVIRRTAIKSGMKTLLLDGIDKAWSGQTTLSEVIRVTATMV